MIQSYARNFPQECKGQIARMRILESNNNQTFRNKKGITETQSRSSMLTSKGLG